MTNISVPMRKYRKLYHQNSEESQVTWVMIIKKMDYSHTLE